MKLIIFAIIAFAIYTYVSRSKEDRYVPDPMAHLSPQVKGNVNQGRTDIESIRSGISRDHKRNSFRGSRDYPEKLSLDGKHLFDNVLLTPINVSTLVGWKPLGNETYQYTYTDIGDNAVFQYNNQTGDFICASSYEKCSLFE